MPHYDYDKDYPFAAFITNLGKYNEGALVGEWVKFPTTAEELKKVFERIGIGAKDDFGQTYEEWFITDFSILSFPLPVSPPSRRPWAPAASACAKPSSCAPGRRTRQSACLWKQRRTPCTISAFSLISYSRKRTAAPHRRLFPSAPF